MSIGAQAEKNDIEAFFLVSKKGFDIFENVGLPLINLIKNQISIPPGIKTDAPKSIFDFSLIEKEVIIRIKPIAAKKASVITLIDLSTKILEIAFLKLIWWRLKHSALIGSPPI